MRAEKITKQEAKRIAQRAGVSFKVDFFVLRASQVDILVDLAKRVGYHKPKNANGSTGRYFFRYLQRA